MLTNASTIAAPHWADELTEQEAPAAPTYPPVDAEDPSFGLMQSIATLCSFASLADDDQTGTQAPAGLLCTEQFRRFLVGCCGGSVELPKVARFRPTVPVFLQRMPKFIGIFIDPKGW